MDQPPGFAAARDRVVQTIADEHRALGEMVHLLRQLVAGIAAEHLATNFALLAATLYYIDDFASRCHHPKEDGYLFPQLRRHAPGALATLGELEADHRHDHDAVRDLCRALVRYQAGAPNALNHFAGTLDSYAAMLSSHIRKEDEMIETFADALPATAWTEIIDGFGSDDGALFTPASQREFERLQHRIANMLPTKLRHYRGE
jgi:hemerythrin-like domain-containing protein